MDIDRLYEEIVCQGRQLTKEESYALAINLLDSINLNDFLDTDKKKKNEDTKLKEILSTASIGNFNIFLHIVKELRGIALPCFKSDTIINIIHFILYNKDGTQLEQMIQHVFIDQVSNLEALGQFSTTIISLCDIVANKQGLKDWKEFQPINYYSHLVRLIYNITSKISTKEQSKIFNKNLVAQILGRLAICGHSDIVWHLFTNPAITQKKLIPNIFIQILRLPMIDINLEKYIEALYLPIFLNYHTQSESDATLVNLLGAGIAGSRQLRYLLCSKLLFTKYSESNIKPLYNIFSYLSSLPEDHLGILNETFMGILKSWSNYSIIKLRSYSHNYYITCGVSIASRFMLNKSRIFLSNNKFQVQGIIMEGVTSYLKCTTTELRNLGICVAELVLPCIKDEAEQMPNLEFGIDLDSKAIKIKDFFRMDPKDLFHNGEKLGSGEIESCVTNDSHESQVKISSELIIEEPPLELDSDDDEDEFEPYAIDDEGKSKQFDSCPPPIYPRDCIMGLAENERPDTVKSCLEMAAKIIRLNSDTIEDVAVEFTKVLLYLDDHFDIDNFSIKRQNAMSSLCTICPQLVGEYLINEFNSPSHNTRHRLDILEVIVSSSYRLSIGDSGGDNNTLTGHDNRGMKMFSSMAGARIWNAVDIDNSLLLLKSLESSATTIDGSDLEKWSSSSSPSPQSSTVTMTSFDDRNLTMNSKTRIIHTKKVPAKLGINTFAKYAGLFFYGLLNSLKMASQGSSNLRLTHSTISDPFQVSENIRPLAGLSRSSNQDIVAHKDFDQQRCDDNENTYLLARTLFSLALILSCVSQLPVSFRMSSNLLEVITDYRSQTEPMVRKGILFCLSTIMTSTPCNQLPDLHDQLMDFKVWLVRQMIGFDRDDDGYKQAEQILLFLEKFSSSLLR